MSLELNLLLTAISHAVYNSVHVFLCLFFSRVGLDVRVASEAGTSHVMDTEDHMLISLRHNSHYTGLWLASHNTKMKIQKPYWI